MTTAAAASAFCVWFLPEMCCGRRSRCSDRVGYRLLRDALHLRVDARHDGVTRNRGYLAQRRDRIAGRRHRERLGAQGAFEVLVVLRLEAFLTDGSTDARGRLQRRGLSRALGRVDVGLADLSDVPYQLCGRGVVGGGVGANLFDLRCHTRVQLLLLEHAQRNLRGFLRAGGCGVVDRDQRDRLQRRTRPAPGVLRRGGRSVVEVVAQCRLGVEIGQPECRAPPTAAASLECAPDSVPGASTCRGSPSAMTCSAPTRRVRCRCAPADCRRRRRWRPAEQGRGPRWSRWRSRPRRTAIRRVPACTRGGRAA